MACIMPTENIILQFYSFDLMIKKLPNIQIESLSQLLPDSRKAGQLFQHLLM